MQYLVNEVVVLETITNTNTMMLPGKGNNTHYDCDAEAIKAS